MVRKPLTGDEIKKSLTAIPDWELRRALLRAQNHDHDDDGDSISRTYRFGGFGDAMRFMSACAVDAEELNHHPEWSNVYNKVAVRLTTHSCNGLTALDFELANRMDKRADAIGLKRKAVKP